MVNCKLDLNALMVDNSAGGSPALLFVYFLSSTLCNEFYKDKQVWTAPFFVIWKLLGYQQIWNRPKQTN